jgi:sporulation protein YlmC with PRC-barrel domain
MLRSENKLRGYSIQATDGEIGKVHEFYFDDDFWIIRYLVVDTGGWLTGRKVLLNPTVLYQPNWDAKLFPVYLTKDQIKNSPHISEDKPVFRQQEISLSQYYNWPFYWETFGAQTGFFTPGASGVSSDILQKGKVEKMDVEVEESDSHLRSTREVTGYHIQAIDGEIGHVEDFILDDETWSIRYIVVDTRNWLPGGKKVLISPRWIEAVKWSDSKVYVKLLRGEIENSPEYDSSKPVGREYEIRLYDFYDQPKYWENQ